MFTPAQSSATSCKDLTSIDLVFVVTNQIIWYQALSYVVQHMYPCKTGQIILICRDSVDRLVPLLSTHVSTHWAPPCSVTVSGLSGRRSKQQQTPSSVKHPFFMNISLWRHHHPHFSLLSQNQRYSNNRWRIGTMNFIWSLSGSRDTFIRRKVGNTKQGDVFTTWKFTTFLMKFIHSLSSCSP